MDLNKAMLIGNITRDPETRTTPGGQTVMSFSVATNLVWKDQSGQKQEKAEFHNIVAWRKLAETLSQYLKKGNKVYVEGRLQTRSWDDQASGVKKYRTEIVADNIIMLDRLSGSGSAGHSNYGAQPAPKNDYAQSSEPMVASAPVEDEINVEDIPF